MKKKLKMYLNYFECYLEGAFSSENSFKIKQRETHRIANTFVHAFVYITRIVVKQHRKSSIIFVIY